MQLTDEQINKIRNMSAALLPPAEIAILLDIPVEQREYFCDICKNHRQTSIYNTYHQGKLQTKYELRQTVIRLAKAGSPAAEPLADKYMREQIVNE